MIKSVANQNGFTYILALTVVMIMGIMLGLVGQSWKTVKQREQEKELLFRGSQIKEAIENWNDPKNKNHPLMDLKDLLQNPYSLTKVRYLPHHYAAELDDANPKCAPDCAKLKVYQDPMTGKEWTIIRGSKSNGVYVPLPLGTQSGGIIGVASKSDETPFKTDFKGTSLENMGSIVVPAAPAVAGTVTQAPVAGTSQSGTETAPAGVGAKMTKYSQWQFIAEPPEKNDHSRIYRAYHEGW